MSRGQQGIGISGAGMYGVLTTGKPVEIISRTGVGTPAHHFKLQIDTKKTSRKSSAIVKLNGILSMAQG